MSAARAFHAFFASAAIAVCGFVACHSQNQQETPIGPLPPSAFHVVWERVDAPPVMAAGSNVSIVVRFRNAGDSVWPDPQIADPAKLSPAHAVRLAYRWLDANGNPVTEYRDRTELPFPIVPNQSIELPVMVTAPAQAGTYRLQFDLVQELVAWFEDRGSARLIVPLRVQEMPK